jgi:hypothetical protein
VTLPRFDGVGLIILKARWLAACHALREKSGVMPRLFPYGIIQPWRSDQEIAALNGLNRL